MLTPKAGWIAASLALLAMTGVSAFAKDMAPMQLTYQRATTSDGQSIATDWQEPDGTPRQLHFRLPNAALNEQAKLISPPSPGLVQILGMQAARHTADQVPQGVHITLTPMPSGLDARASGPMGLDLNVYLNAVMASYRRAADQAAIDAGYRFRSPQLIEPDFRRLVDEHAHLLAETAHDIAVQTSELSPRQRTQVLVSFLQSLPYQTFSDRANAPMRTPAGVLADDKGDCDAKSLTLATFLSVTNPALHSVMIYDDAHAFLGVSLPVEPGDTAFTLGGITYVALEPVGPGWFPVGQISQMSQAILASGKAQNTILR